MEDYRQVHITVNTEQTTAYGYSVIENHIKAYFDSTGKNTRFDKITTTTVNQYYKYLRGIRTKRLPNGMGANTIRKHYNYLSQLSDYAFKHSDVYGIHISPMKNSTQPNKQKAVTPDLKPYNIDKIVELLSTLHKNKDLPLECAVLINKELLGNEYFDSDYVLVRADGKPYAPKWVCRKFSEFLEKYKFPRIRYHDLRHLNASMLLKVLPVTDVSEHLGHSTINTTTRVYAHSLLKRKSEIAEGFDNMFVAS